MKNQFIRSLLDLDRFFYVTRDLPYVLVRGCVQELLPRYIQSSDLDIFCYDKREFGKRILEVANDYVADGFEIEVIDFSDGKQTHVDFLKNGTLELRFDLYGWFPRYRKTQIKEHLFLSVIENGRAVQREWQGKPYPLYVPHPVDDLLLRYIEYVEYYEQRPDKLKHLEYILSAVEHTPGRIRFIDKLHQYTDLPKCSIHTPVRKVGQIPYEISIRYHAKGLCLSILRQLISESMLYRLIRGYSRLKI